MFEKVNPSHPDKVADRISGAIVDLAYNQQNNPKIAGEILLGHNYCHIICETNCHFKKKEIKKIVHRIVGTPIKVDYLEVPQDVHLANNQKNSIKCGDNGIFKGVPITKEQDLLLHLAKDIYKKYPTDGKYLINKKTKELVICQSCANEDELKAFISNLFPTYNIIVNPLGKWSGGINVDTGCANRKLGSDMGDSITGGGLHFKDASKADVSANIYCFLKAQETHEVVSLYCAIGDEILKGTIGTKPFEVSYTEIVETAMNYIKLLGGFENFAKWGLLN